MKILLAEMEGVCKLIFFNLQLYFQFAVKAFLILPTKEDLLSFSDISTHNSTIDHTGTLSKAHSTGTTDRHQGVGQPSQESLQQSAERAA